MTGDSVLVVGLGGQLACGLAERAAAAGIEASFVGRPEVDLLEPESLRDAVAASGAAVVINAAAYTAVDQAESEPDIARRVNALAPGLLAAAARDCGARLIHVSTDYVFDGRKNSPYEEDDATGPNGVYGRTKLEGEKAVRAALREHVIVRTSWVYSPFGRNFVTAMLGAARTGPEVRVVDDQVGTPTSALDLADGLLVMVRAWRERPDLGLGATYHLAGTGATSWAGLALEIFRISAEAGHPSPEVIPISTESWPSPARRPANSALASTRFAATFGYIAPVWRQSLRTCVERLLVQNAFGKDESK